MIIRKAEIEDARVIYDFVITLDREDAEVRLPIMAVEDIEKAGFGNDPLFEAYIAEKEGGAPIGVISFFRGYSGWHAKPIAIIHMLYVSKDARKQNVARRLMAKAASVIVERGWARLQLCVEEGRPAIHFYESIGMEDCKERHYKIEEDALVKLAAQAED